MIKVLQTRTGAPHGNCHAACIASILELPLTSVPDHIWPDDVPWREAQDGPQQTARGLAVRTERSDVFQAFYETRGFSTFCCYITGWIPKGYALGGVTNVRGIPHYVVCLDGKIV